MNKKLVKWMSVFVIFTIFLGMFSNCSVNAAINKEYLSGGENPIVADEDAVIKSSIVTDYIGGFVYTIGTIIESLTSKIMLLLTGTKSFPWADKVIFNTVPLLDVNFINADSQSLLTENNDARLSLGGIIRNIYFTGLSLALGFLAIIVAVMAIKLAISTISSEKAKYKEAIVKWLTSIVLLFGMHFVLSFIFYMNEELVVVASRMMMTALENEADVKSVIDTEGKDTQRKIVETFWGNVEQTKFLQSLNPFNMADAVTQKSLEIGGNIASLLTGDPSKQIDPDGTILAEENTDVVCYLLQNETIRKTVIPDVSDRTWGDIISKSDGFWDGFKSAIKEVAGGVKNFAESVLVSDDNSVYVQIYNFACCVNKVNYASGLDEKDINEAIAYCDDVIEGKIKPMSAIVAFFEKPKEEAEVNKILLKLAIDKKNGNISNTKTYGILSSLGETFKKRAWYTDTDKGEWSANSVSITSAILYTVFVIQSLMFFIAYVKRFFYVVILAVIAPFVVIYDFFVKSATL